MRKDPKLKYGPGKSDPQEQVYYYFKIDPSRYMLYDSELGEPIEFGSINKVAAAISKLSKNCTIYRFHLGGPNVWQLKAAVKPGGITADSDEKKEKIERKKQETQEDKSKNN